MGHIQYHAILVTSFNRRSIERVSSRAVELDLDASDILPSPCGGLWSLLILPDAAKEGGDFYAMQAARRAALFHFLDTEMTHEGYTDLGWVAVRYGSDQGAPATIERASQL